MRNRFVVLCGCLLALVSACAGADNESGGLEASRASDAAGAGTGASAGSGGGSAGTGGAAGMSSGLGPELGDGDFSSGAPTAGTSAAAGTGGAGGAGGDGFGMSAGTGADAPSGEFSAGDGDGDSADPIDSGDGDGDSGSQQPIAALTAGVWDDNRNFERFSNFRSEVLQENQASGAFDGELAAADSDFADAHDQFQELGGARQKLDIALVIDTTGSMGDEIGYLQAELTAISASVEASYPNADQRWGLIVYRDAADAYLTRDFELTANLDDMREHLNAQDANGGGDFPEAAQAGLAAGNELAWRAGDDVARLVFWVADAPSHAADKVAMTEAIFGAQDLGVHIYPVASSGIDRATELLMRSTAQLTGGRYVFLTDDSGIGGAHLEPSIPCYFVTKLSDAMVRMIDIEMSGTYSEPEEDQIIRTAGDPQDGACTLEDDEEVEIF